MSETALPAEVPTSLPPELFLDHRLADNEFLATFARLCASAIQAKTWPVYQVGALQMKALTGFARIDRAQLTLESLMGLGLIEIEEGSNGSLTLTILAAC